MNQSRLIMYGKTIIQFEINRKIYRHKAYIADVDNPIIGNDILRKFKLSQIWNNHDQLELVDRKANV